MFAILIKLAIVISELVIVVEAVAAGVLIIVATLINVPGIINLVDGVLVGLPLALAGGKVVKAAYPSAYPY